MDLLLVLRGLAALIVVFWHSVGYTKPEWLPAVFNMPGRAAVWLFFGISGYVIAYGFVHRRYELSPSGFRAFYRNRALRILPLFFLLTAVSWVLAVATTGKSPLEWKDVPAQVFALQFDHNYVLNGVFWTLGIEIQFYVLAPVLVLPLLMKGKGWIAGAALLYGASVLWVYYSTHTLGWTADGRNVLANLPHFLAGMIACRAAQPLKPDRLRGWIAFAVGCGLLLHANRLYHRHYTEFLDTQGILVMDAIIASFVIAHASWEPLSTKKGRIYIVLAFLGTLSYGVYAWHTIIMKHMPWTEDKVLPLVALTIAAACLSYWFVERPSLSLKARRPLHPDASATLLPSKERRV